MPLCSAEEFLKAAEFHSRSGDAYGNSIREDDGRVKYVRAKQLYGGMPKYIITVSDITNAKKEPA